MLRDEDQGNEGLYGQQIRRTRKTLKGYKQGRNLRGKNPLLMRNMQVNVGKNKRLWTINLRGQRTPMQSHFIGNWPCNLKFWKDLGQRQRRDSFQDPDGTWSHKGMPDAQERKGVRGYSSRSPQYPPVYGLLIHQGPAFPDLLQLHTRHSGYVSIPTPQLPAK